MNVIDVILNGLFQGILFYPVVLSLALSYRLLKFPDISIEGTFALGSAVFAIIFLKTDSFIFSILISSFSAFIAGGITAILHHYLHINKFLSGILLVTGLYSISIRILGSSNVSILSKYISNSNVQYYFLFGSLIISILVLFFYKSGFGIKIRGAALNPTLSNNIGLKTGVLLVIGLALNNIFAALSGVFFTINNGFSDIKLGQGILIVGLAALAIGEHLIPKKNISIPLFVILSAFVGSIFYQILWAFALKINIEPSDLKLLSALIVIVLFIIKKEKIGSDEL